MATPHDRILRLAEKIRQYKADGTHKRLSEQDTKAVFVEPLLEIVGWAVRDPAQVSREDRPTERPVDYSLKLEGKPSVLVECKRLSNRLDRRKDLEQALAYAAAAGVRWCVLTNGSVVRIYNSLAAEEASKKLLEELDLATVGTAEGPTAERAAETLRLISPRSVESGQIDGHWERRYTGAKLREVVKALVSEPDPDFVNLVRRRMKERDQRLSKKEAARWLKTVDIKVRTRPAKSKEEVSRREPAIAPGKMTIGRDTFEIGYSYETLINTAEWLITKGKLSRRDCPVPIGRKRHLIHIEPKHRHGDDFTAPKRLSNGLWIEVHYSSEACIRNARRLLETLGYRGDMLQVH